MDYKKFISFNILGAICWIASFTTLGFMLGENVWIKEQLEWIIIGLILITTVPVIFKMVFSKRKKTIAAV